MSLFACTYCHSRHPFEELSKGDQLCKKCRKTYPLVTCTYCRMEFHLLRGTEGKPVCKKCETSVKQFGQPSCCVYCNIRAAFNGTKCTRCESSEKKYGAPVLCEQCKLKCAFKKSDESKGKVDGKILCLLCTLSYKRLVHKSKKNSNERSEEHSHSHGHHKGTKRDIHHHHHHTKHEKKSKIAKIDSDQPSVANKPHISVGGGARDSPVTAFGLYNASSGNSDVGGEPPMSDHMAELTDLKEQLLVLKKQLQQKDQALIEKEKKITELKADNWEKEKDSKKKLTALQKDQTERLEFLQMENRNLKKQVSALSKPVKDKTMIATSS